MQCSPAPDDTATRNAACRTREWPVLQQEVWGEVHEEDATAHDEAWEDISKNPMISALLSC